MSLFVGNSSTYTKDVESLYSKIETYDTTDEESKYLGEVVLKEDFDNRISTIRDDVESAISLIENHYDTSSALDELKILSEKLY